jgi:hypothetical protein
LIELWFIVVFYGIGASHGLAYTVPHRFQTQAACQASADEFNAREQERVRLSRNFILPPAHTARCDRIMIQKDAAE